MKLQETLRARFYDLVNEKKDRHLAETLANLVRNDVLVIVNHNDTTSENELKNITARTDNDKNTIYISEIIEQYSAKIQLKVGKVIYLTNTDGVLDNDWNTLSWWSFSQNDFGTEKVKYLAYVNTEKSKAWTWWMESKINCAFESLRLWAEQSIISNARRWLDCLKFDSSLCTKFSMEMEEDNKL